MARAMGLPSLLSPIWVRFDGIWSRQTVPNDGTCGPIPYEITLCWVIEKMYIESVGFNVDRGLFDYWHRVNKA